MTILAMIMIFAIPIVAILSSNYYKLEKAKLDTNSKQKDSKLLEKMTAENNALRERIENLEYIVTNLDESLLPTKAVDDKTASLKRIEEMTKRLKN